MQTSTVRRNAVLPALQVNPAGPRIDPRAILRAGMLFAAIAGGCVGIWQVDLLKFAHWAW